MKIRAAANKILIDWSKDNLLIFAPTYSGIHYRGQSRGAYAVTPDGERNFFCGPWVLLVQINHLMIEYEGEYEG